MKKRLISLALTLALCLGLAIPVMAAGSYGPYTITGASYGRAFTVTFSAAKTESRTIQIREYGDIDNTYSAYQKKTVTYVTIRPDTKVMALSGDEPMVSVAGVSADGDGRYTQIVMGAPETIENGTGWDAFITDFPLVYLYSDTGEYLITMDSSATPSGFTDVKVGAYYADAVKWAVDKKITSGTSDTTFSPDQTCTVAQILTFLWNANGKPEPTGRNPFSDISSGDYFYRAAVWAASKGLVSGSKLNPNAPRTRAMVMEYFWRLAGSPVQSYSPYKIKDSSEGYSWSVSFEAAQVNERTIVDTTDGYREWTVIVVSVKAGTQITVQSSHEFANDSIQVAFGDDEPDYYIRKNTSTSVSDEQLGFGDAPYNLESGVVSLTKNQYYDCWTGDPDKGTDHTYHIILGDDTGIAPSFTDVPSSAAYAQAVAWAVEKGVTAGKSDTTFAPDATCTRGEIVTFLRRAMG